MTYQIRVTRAAYCDLEATFEVEADSQEEAENKALMMSEDAEDASLFTVTSIDLTSDEGSSEVVRP